MVSAISNENKIVIPFLGVIFIAAVIITIVQQFLNVDLGFVGLLSNIVTILGFGAFIFYIIINIIAIFS